ncbi:uncharacterized protein AB9X84_023225 isoform 2-T2 [Acanthopagrus schlegelii]
MAEVAGPSTGYEHFVDKHRSELIEIVSDVEPILNELLHQNVIQQESYDKIKTLPTAEEKMRELISGPLKSCGVLGKDIFYEILIENEPLLIQDLETMDAEAETMSRLCETLNVLNSEELGKFKTLIDLETGFPLFSRNQHEMTNTWDIVELMVETYSRQYLGLTKYVLKLMERTDLVQRLIDTCTATKEKHRPSLRQRVEMMESVIELLLEALKDLSEAELKEFKTTLCLVYLFGDSFVQLMQQRVKYIPLDPLDKADMQGTVCLMVQYYGQQSVEMTKESLKMMKRTDLVQRLTDSSSRPKKKLQSSLINKAATMRAVKDLLLETLNDLSYEEQKNLKWFLQFTFFQRSLPQIHWSRLLEEDMAEDMAESLVDVMVEKYGQKSVEVTREVLMDMNRTDLVRSLSETSSELEVAAGSSGDVFGVNTTEKEKHSVEEDWPALIQKVESMESVIELLLETLKHLSVAELEEFRDALLSQPEFHRHFLSTPLMLLQTAHVQDTVFFMVQICGQKCLEKTKYILMTMMRTDLVQRLSDSSSGSKKKHSADEHRSALIHKIATIAAVQQLLLETLNNLSYKELGEFKEILPSIISKKVLPDISSMWSYGADRADMVNEMVHTYGQQSVELTREVLMDMERTDLVQRLSKPSSGLKDKHSVDEHLSELMQKGATITTDRERLLNVLEHLKQEEFQKFKWFLQDSDILTGLPGIPHHRLEEGDMLDVVDLMLQTYSQQSVELTKKVLMDISRYDLVQRLSKPSSGLKGPSRGLEHEDIGSAMDSSDWTKIEPEVNSTDADEAPTYSLQSEAGNFECSVSGLRWVCKEKVSFKYQFCSWEEPMERMESMKYMLAGPLIDITVDAWKLDEVFLPHWICIDDNPEILNKFAVLHIDDCGDVVEKVAEVTSSHVKLSEPVFSPRAVLMKVGVPVKINCKVLIYKTNTAFLTLHVYLIPCDPGLQQELNRRQFSSGYRAIQKPHPENSLKMRDRFILTADLDGAEIYPEKLKLRYESRDPNFFEVYVENPDRKFTLKLTKENEHQPVWTCALRKEEYQSSALIQVEHFVDKHQCDLIARVSNTGPILDNLLREGVIQQEDYDTIRTIPTTQERMRKLFSGPLKAGGQAAKDVFFRILKKEESYLVADLDRKES